MALRFPRTDRDKYKARVKFQVQQAVPPSVGSTSGSTNASASQNSSDNLEDNSILGAIKNEYNQNMEALKDFIKNDVLPSGFNTTISGGSFISTGKIIELYMPNGIQIQDAVQFDNKDFGIIGAGVEQAARSGNMTVAGAIGRVANPVGEITAIASALREDVSGGTARALASRAATAVGETTGNVVSSIAQVQVNPNTRSVFQGVPIREFNFAFKLIPTNKDESNTIKNIIDLFRTELYPDTIEQNGISVGFEFPNRFLINMYYGGNRIQPHFLPCYLRSINTVYNTTSQSFYKGGDFSEVDISLTFVEVRALTKRDIGNGITSTGNSNPIPNNNSNSYTVG